MFAVVIAITKDLADVEGDRKYGIETFSTRLGTRRVTFLGMSPPVFLMQISVIVRQWVTATTEGLASQESLARMKIFKVVAAILCLH